MPNDAVLLDQGNTYRCGAYSVREFWEGAGHDIANTLAWRQYTMMADRQAGLSFGQVHGMVVDLSLELGVTVRWLGDGFLRDFGTHDQAVRDDWCVVDGVMESELLPGQRYFHYVAIDGIDEAYQPPIFKVQDPFHVYDGEDGIVAVTDLHAGIGKNWDPVLIGCAWRFD